MTTLPIVPTVEAWRAMTRAERLDFQVRVLDALSDPIAAMSEGRPHKKAKSRALDALGLHFRATGRVIYLAEEMAVLYPGQRPFTPDLLAVLDVAEPEEDERMSWVVADEGKGLDLVIEVLHHGDREKDLVENVERYAELGIPEYFVYDRLERMIHGHRLAGPGARRYERVVPQLGRYRSNVLGLDLVILENRLRFFAGEAELPGSGELLTRLHGMMASLEAKVESEANQARAQGEAAASARAVLAVLAARGIDVPEGDRERILAQSDLERLGRWLKKAVVAASIAEVLDEPT
jgi:Uma2 family endonuclease